MPSHDPSSPAATDPEELLRIAVEAAAAASAYLVESLHRDDLVHESKTSATDMVTDVDRTSERLIVGHILAARPGDGILGEEGGTHEGSTGVRWIIDPLDGTTNFLYGHGGFGVSVAAEIDGTVVAAAVHDPLGHDEFAAVLGGGATRNGTPISVNDPVDTAVALVATGFAYQAERRALQAGVLTTLLPAVRDIRRMGAAAVDLCSVACGRVDAFYERGLGAWDFAAGALIASEAGALVGDLSGGPPSGEFVLAAGPALFGPLAAILRDAGAATA